MTEPNAREREIAAAVNLGAGNWTEAIAQVLADYRVELCPPINVTCDNGWHAFTLDGPCVICGKEQTP